MPTIETIYKGQLRTGARHMATGIEIITDAPLDNKGKGETFSPTDLLAASLGSCMLTIMGIAAETHGFVIDGTCVSITKVMASNPRRVAEIGVELRLPAMAYDAQQKKIIEQAALTCPVALSLHPSIKQDVRFIYP